MRLLKFDDLNKAITYYDFQFKSNMFLYESIQTIVDLNKKGLMMNMIGESSDIKGLLMIYEDTKVNTTNQKQGIVSSLVNAIIGLVSSVIDVIEKFVKSLTGNNIPKSTIMPSSDAEALKNINTLQTEISSAVSKSLTEPYSLLKLFGTGAGVVGGAGLIAGGLKALISMRKDKKGEESKTVSGANAVNGVKAANGIFSNLKKITLNIKKKIDENPNDSKLIKILQNVEDTTQDISRWSNRTMTYIKNSFTEKGRKINKISSGDQTVYDDKKYQFLNNPSTKNEDVVKK